MQKRKSTVPWKVGALGRIEECLRAF